MGAFLQFAGEKGLAGQSTDPRHIGWIHVASFHLVPGRSGPAVRGGAYVPSSLRVTTPDVLPVPVLRSASAAGRAFERVVLEVTKERRMTVRLHMAGVYVDALQWAGDLTQFTLECRSLRFEAAEGAEAKPASGARSWALTPGM